MNLVLKWQEVKLQNTVDEALAIADKLGYPVVVRPATLQWVEQVEDLFTMLMN